MLADAVLKSPLVHGRDGGTGVVVHGGRKLLVVHAPRGPSGHGTIVVLHLSVRLRILETPTYTSCEGERGAQWWKKVRELNNKTSHPNNFPAILCMFNTLRLEDVTLGNG